jgi:hypothetical protein
MCLLILRFREDSVVIMMLFLGVGIVWKWAVLPAFGGTCCLHLRNRNIWDYLTFALYRQAVRQTQARERGIKAWSDLTGTGKRWLWNDSFLATKWIGLCFYFFFFFWWAWKRSRFTLPCANFMPEQNVSWRPFPCVSGISIWHQSFLVHSASSYPKNILKSVTAFPNTYS